MSTGQKEMISSKARVKTSSMILILTTNCKCKNQDSAVGNCRELCYDRKSVATCLLSRLDSGSNMSEDINLKVKYQSSFTFRVAFLSLSQFSGNFGEQWDFIVPGRRARKTRPNRIRERFRNGGGVPREFRACFCYRW